MAGTFLTPPFSDFLSYSLGVVVVLFTTFLTLYQWIHFGRLHHSLLWNPRPCRTFAESVWSRCTGR